MGNDRTRSGPVQTWSDRFPTGSESIAGNGRLGTVEHMHDLTYTLSELARLTGRSRNTLKQMIADNQLAATASDNGRREVRVSHADAVAAGLRIRDRSSHASDNLDGAARALLDEVLAPVLHELEGLRDELVRRLSDIEQHLEGSATTLQTLPRSTAVNDALPSLRRRWWVLPESVRNSWARLRAAHQRLLGGRRNG